jgi:hypothetical protein
MLWKKVTLAALTGTALLAAAPAFADNYREGRFYQRGDHFQRRMVVVHDRSPHYYGERRVFVQRPAVVHRPVVVQQPVVVYREPSAHQVLGGLILGTVIGVAIANHAAGGY